MKKKKTLTPEEKAAKKAKDAAAKEHLDKAIDSFAGDKTPEEWSTVFKHCAKARFASGYILTRCKKKIAWEAYKNKVPYCDIKPVPLFCERTFKRYIKEFEKLS